MRTARRRVTALQIQVWALALVVLAGCAEQGEKREFLGPPASEGPPNAAISRLIVSPSLGTVQRGEPISFAAFGHRSAGDSVGVEVMWTASGGTVDGSGVFSAPTPGTYWVVARSVQQADKADSAAVYVVGPDNPVTSIEMTPKHLNLELGDVQQFTAQAKLQSGASATVPIFWTASGGTIDGSGLYSATDEGPFIVVAIAANGLSDTSAVFVQPRRQLRTVRIEPAEVDVVAGGHEQFDVKAEWTDGTITTPSTVDYSTDGGTIDAKGNFTALSTEGDFVVVASARGSSQLARAVVRIKPASVTGVSINPGSVRLSRGGWMLFLASARYSDGSNRMVSPSWKATGGSIDNFGVFRAGQRDGQYTVIATVGNVSDTAQVVVGSPAATLSQLVLNPGSVTLGAGESQTFTVAGSWSDGSSTVPPVTYRATGGTISDAGVYRAGSTPGTYRVIATHEGGTRADTSEVRVTAPSVSRLAVDPERVTVETGKTTQFSANATLSDGSASSAAPVTWTAAGGTITSAGRFTAGSSTGTFRVIGRTSNGAADTSLVTVSAPAPVLQAVVVTPAQATVQSGQQQAFVANGSWTNGGSGVPAVTWTATGGTISGTGVYTAGSTAGTFRVIARHQSGLADTSVVTIPQPAPVLTGVVLSPSSATVQAGSTQRFSVTGVWTNGGSGTPTVTYSATGGSISSSGVFVAGSTAGRYRVIATQQGGRLADTSDVTVTVAAPQLVGLDVSPSGVTVAAGATQQYTVSGVWTNGGSGAPAVTWSATGGSISSTGLFTAGSSAGTYRVIARQNGGTIADTVNLTVAVTAPTLTDLRVSPKTATVQTGLTQQFTVAATWSNGSTTAPSVRWSATGGSIGATTGLFTAPGTPGTYRVIARHQDGTIADTSTVTVVAPVVTALALTPGNTQIDAGGTQQYQAMATWSDGVNRPAAVSYSTTGGSISTTGVYSAPSTSGNYRVNASTGGVSAPPATVTVEAAQTPPEPPQSGGLYPNEPTGSTLITDYGFTSSLKAGGWDEAWNPSSEGVRLGTVSDASAPVSGPLVLEWTFPVGARAGGAPMLEYTFKGTNRLYWAFWFKLGSTFPTKSMLHKLAYIEPNNVILVASKWTGDPTTGDFYLRIFSGGQYPLANRTATPLKRDKWHRVEMSLDRSGSGGSHVLQWWVDGVLQGTHTNQNYSAGAFSRAKFTPQESGSGGSNPTAYTVRFDHTRLSTRP